MRQSDPLDRLGSARLQMPCHAPAERHRRQLPQHGDGDARSATSSSLNIYDPSGAPGGAGLEATKQIILERIDQLAPFRRRLVEVPLGLDLPYWIEDPDFDIDFHVRHHAVPPPGTPEQLAEAVSRIVARPLDRSRPLWELYVIEGVDDGRLIAQLTKVHHATIDGASGALMLAVDPRHRPRRPPDRASPRPWDARARADRRRAAAASRSAEYLRRPEKLIRLDGAHAARAGRVDAERRPAGARRPGRPADARARSATLMRERLRSGYGDRGRRPAAAAADAGAAHAVEPADHAAPPLRLHDDPARRRQGDPPRVRLHVQRRRHGAVLGHAAPLPAEARLPARRAADRDGAGQRPRSGDGGRHLPEPRVGAARRPGHQRAGSRQAPAPRAADA